jgi:hypothetical protein
MQRLSLIPMTYFNDISLSQKAYLQSNDAAILKTAEDEAEIDAKLAGPTTDQERTEKARACERHPTSRSDHADT